MERFRGCAEREGKDSMSSVQEGETDGEGKKKGDAKGDRKFEKKPESEMSMGKLKGKGNLDFCEEKGGEWSLDRSGIRK